MAKHKLHYHVTVGFPGYLPNSNYPCATLSEAYSIAKYEKDDFIDTGWDDDHPTIRVTGDIRRDHYYTVYRYDGDEWNEWQYIEIAECTEPDCCDDSGEIYSE